MKIEIRSGNKNDIPQLARLAFGEYGPGDIADENYLRWQYFQNPAGNALITVTVDSKKSVVAQYVNIPVKFSVDGSIVTAGLSLNTIVAKAHRGQGLFSKTAKDVFGKCNENGISFTFGVPNKMSKPGFIKSLGFREIALLSVGFRIINFPEFIKSLLLNRKTKKGDELPFEFKEIQNESYSLRELDLSKDSEIYSTFYESWKRKHRFFTDRNLEYMDWRFRKIPNRKYYLLRFMKESKMEGLIVLRAHWVYGMPAISIVDCCVLSMQMEVKSLLKQLYRQLSKNNFAIVWSMGSGMDFSYGVFQFLGLAKFPTNIFFRNFPLIIRQHSDLIDVPGIKNWYFTMGDFDIV